MGCLVGLAAALSAAPLLHAGDGEGTRPPEVDRVEEAVEIRPGAVVHLEYTLRNEQGEVLDSNQGRVPLVFTQGKGEVIPGLEGALLGMKVGEHKRVTVPPDEGYGPIDPTAITEVPKNRVPPDALAVGARVRGQTRSGREMWVRVREVKDETVVLDLNHPLAGQTLVFDVTIILIEPP